MELEHFGTYLKAQREAKGMSLADLSRATKIKESNLEHIEAGRVERLPAPVFVRGFVQAYARAVGIDPGEALAKLRAATRALEPPPPEPSPAPPDEAEAPQVDRRRFGVVMVVFLILVVATLTLSLLLGHGGQRGPGIS